MAELNCSSCAELQDHASEFILNGVTDNVCASLANNEGFSPSDDYDSEEDLKLANDCLIGNMVEEIDAYDVCDWKDYIRKLIPNLWNMLKAIICTLSGLWSRIDCIVDTFSEIHTRRMWIQKADLNYQSGFNIDANSTGVAVSYCNTHCYILFGLTSSKLATLNSGSAVYSSNGYLVCEGTGTWNAPYNITRQEEQVGITSGGFFTYMAKVENVSGNTYKFQVWLRSRLRDLNDATTPFSKDGIIVNMPTTVKMFDINNCN